MAVDLIVPVATAGDPVFEERWNAWMARGRQHDLAVRARLRIAAIAGLIAALLVIGRHLLGGSL
jgi:hypothetical protein